MSRTVLRFSSNLNQILNRIAIFVVSAALRMGAHIALFFIQDDAE
jgi:hypothetical protein